MSLTHSLAPGNSAIQSPFKAFCMFLQQGAIPWAVGLIHYPMSQYRWWQSGRETHSTLSLCGWVLSALHEFTDRYEGSCWLLCRKWWKTKEYPGVLHIHYEKEDIGIVGPTPILKFELSYFLRWKDRYFWLTRFIFLHSVTLFL